jgi:hypothetical protein
VIEIDGSRHSGSGTIVRQAVAFAALTRQDVHITNARARRRRAGLRRQHVPDNVVRFGGAGFGDEPSTRAPLPATADRPGGPRS